jgi:hypothetical protein
MVLDEVVHPFADEVEHPFATKTARFSPTTVIELDEEQDEDSDYIIPERKDFFSYGSFSQTHTSTVKKNMKSPINYDEDEDMEGEPDV